MNGRQGADPIYTQADWSGIGSGIANALGQVFGFGGSPGPQAQQAPQAQPSPSRFAPIIPQALQSPRPAPLPPAGPSLATSAPLPPPRPADLGQASPAQQIDLPTFDVSAAPMPSRPVTPTPSPVPNAAPLAAATSIPVNLPPASSPARDSAALGAAASIPVQLPAASAQPAAQGPWTKYQTAQPSQPAPVTRDPWERPTSADDKPWLDFQAAKPGASAQAAEGPWTKYQTAQPSQPAPVARDPWERPENNNAPWLDYQAAKPEPTVGAFIDPYANNTLADDTRLIGGLADKAVRNVVNGATLGYGDKIAAGLDALTGRSPDYASALNAERAQSAQAMAQPGGLGTAEQIAGMALPAGAIGRGAAALGEAASALPFGLGRFAASPLAQASATGAAVGGINAAGNDQPVAPNAVLGALAGAGGNVLARSVARVLAGPAVTAVAPTTQAVKDAAQAGYDQADKAGVIVSPDALARLRAGIENTLAKNAYDPALQPKGAVIVNHIGGWAQPGATPVAGQPPFQGATLRDLDILRQKAANLYDPLNDSSSRLGQLVKGHIDDFVNGLTPADTTAGGPRAAAAALNNARSDWTTYSKSNDISEALANAQAKSELRDAQPGIIGKLTSQAIAKVRDSRSNWTSDELAALNEAANGTPTARALALIGRLAPTSPLMAVAHAAGGGLGALATGGAAIPASAAVAAGTLGARAVANRMTANAADRLGNIIRSGGSAPLTIAPMGPRVASPLAALLMGGGINATQPAQPYPPGLGAAFAQ